MVGSGLSPPMIITRVLMVRALVFSKCVDFVPLLRRPGFPRSSFIKCQFTMRYMRTRGSV